MTQQTNAMTHIIKLIFEDHSGKKPYRNPRRAELISRNGSAKESLFMIKQAIFEWLNTTSRKDLPKDFTWLDLLTYIGTIPDAIWQKYGLINLTYHLESTIRLDFDQLIAQAEDNREDFTWTHSSSEERIKRFWTWIAEHEDDVIAISGTFSKNTLRLMLRQHDDILKSFYDAFIPNDPETLVELSTLFVKDAVVIHNMMPLFNDNPGQTDKTTSEDVYYGRPDYFKKQDKIRIDFDR